MGGAGDVALLGSGQAAFTAGLVSFAAGHVAWILAVRQRPGAGYLRARPVLAAPDLAAFGALNAYLWKRTGKDRLPVLAYSTALLAMSRDGAGFRLAPDGRRRRAVPGLGCPARGGQVRRLAPARPRGPGDGAYARAQALLAG